MSTKLWMAISFTLTPKEIINKRDRFSLRAAVRHSMRDPSLGETFPFPKSKEGMKKKGEPKKKQKKQSLSVPIPYFHPHRELIHVLSWFCDPKILRRGASRASL